jgi:hypothetical protein
MADVLEKSPRPVRRPTKGELDMMKTLREGFGVYGDELSKYADDGSLHQRLKKINKDEPIDAHYNREDKTINVHENLFNPYVISHELRHKGIAKMLEEGDDEQKQKINDILSQLPEEILVETLDLLRNEFEQTVNLPDKLFGMMDGGQKTELYNRAVVEFLPSLKAIYKTNPALFDGYGIKTEDDLVIFLNSNERFTEYNLVDSEANKKTLDEMANEMLGITKTMPGQDM